MEAILEATQAFVTDSRTLHWASWIGVALVIVPVLMAALSFKRFLDDFNPANFTGVRVGPIAKTQRAIENDIARLKRMERSIIATGFSRSLAFITVGVIIPGLLIALILKFQSWFLPGQHVLVDQDGRLLFGSDLSLGELFWFTFDQALRGGLSDFFEIFGRSVSHVSNNQSHATFSTIIFFYRFLAGATFTSVALVALRLAPGSKPLKAGIVGLEGQREYP
jgi:hypothetical protein